MRLLALLLSLYVICLTALPCADVPDRGHEAPLTQQSHNHDDADCCSPFCTCNCCAMAMHCEIQAVDFQVRTLVREQITAYPTLIETQRVGEIWQPPKLA